MCLPMHFSLLSLRWIFLAKCTRYEVCSGLLCHQTLLLNNYKRKKLALSRAYRKIYCCPNKQKTLSKEEHKEVEQSSWVLHCSKELSYVLALETKNSDSLFTYGSLIMLLRLFPLYLLSAILSVSTIVPVHRYFSYLRPTCFQKVHLSDTHMY